MPLDDAHILIFKDRYFERIWGGRTLEKLFGKRLPPNACVGEAWLISDHAQHISVVAKGPFEGRTLHELLTEDSKTILGSLPKTTPTGRFPLMLKILDARQKLSVQVHPDDAAALRFEEPDPGKTEFWHVLDAETDSELHLGLKPGVAREEFEAALGRGTVSETLARHRARTGMSIFVPAGTVHTIGGGITLAEIQQNSDLTYRIHDWERSDETGAKRELHLEKALEVIQFGEVHPGATEGLECGGASDRRTLLAACERFAAESAVVTGTYERAVGARSFHIILAVSGELKLSSHGSHEVLTPGMAALLTGSADTYRVEGKGKLLDFYVPHMDLDIRKPLAEHGYSTDLIRSTFRLS